MERKAVLGIMLMLLLTSMLILTSPIQLALAESETMLYINPEETKVTVGDIFVVDVNVADVADLYGYEIWLSYNASFLDVISAGPPYFLPPPPPIIQIIPPEGPEGIIHISQMLYPPEPGVSGSGTLVSITFNATAPGSDILDLFDTTLFDPYLNSIPHTVVDGSVTVLSTINER